MVYVSFMANTNEPEAAALPWEANFARAMREQREQRRLSQYGLARDLSSVGLSMHQQQIDRIENAQRPVKLNEAIAIARYFGVTLDAMATLAPDADATLEDQTRALAAAARGLARHRDESRERREAVAHDRDAISKVEQWFVEHSPGTPEANAAHAATIVIHGALERVLDARRAESDAVARAVADARQHSDLVYGWSKTR